MPVKSFVKFMIPIIVWNVRGSSRVFKSVVKSFIDVH